MNILLGVTGSVAAIKLPELHEALRPIGAVRIVATQSALFFIKKIRGHHFVRRPLDDHHPIVYYGWGLQNMKTSDVYPIHGGHMDEDEWLWEDLGDDVLHIKLKDWADIMVIAPLTANTLAKIANGICDNLLTCVCRAWQNKPVVLAPAMNTDMWEHPITQRQLQQAMLNYEGYDNEKLCQVRNVFIVDPVEKKLACGTTGMGAMAPVEDIAKMVRDKAR
jgi:phosphopantothenoylcysteine decarboxylase